jgi:hypothetical protein
MAESTVSLVLRRLAYRRCNLAVYHDFRVSFLTLQTRLGQISTLQVRACVYEASALSDVRYFHLRARVLEISTAVACLWRHAWCQPAPPSQTLAVQSCPTQLRWSHDGNNLEVIAPWYLMRYFNTHSHARPRQRISRNPHYVELAACILKVTNFTAANCWHAVPRRLHA